jgi:hypothetical protein
MISLHLFIYLIIHLVTLDMSFLDIYVCMLYSYFFAT